MRNKIYDAILLLLLGIICTGCMPVYDADRIPESTAPVLKSESGMSRSKDEPVKLDIIHDVDGFKLRTIYDVDPVILENWRITDTKSIRMRAMVEGLKEGTEVLIEHVHCDMSLASTTSELNGLKQDEMDDSYHGFSQDGFDVTLYPYENIFAVEGYSKFLTDGWMFQYGAYGSGRVSEQRLKESTLLYSGVYGSKLTVVYDLLIKSSGEKRYHVKSVCDSILIPVRKENTEEVRQTELEAAKIAVTAAEQSLTKEGYENARILVKELPDNLKGKRELIERMEAIKDRVK